MKMINKGMNLLVAIGASLLVLGCSPAGEESWKEASEDPAFLHRSMKQLTDVIVHDIFSPPVASRIYAYSSIAAYEVLCRETDSYRSLSGQLNGLEEAPLPEPGAAYCYSLAAVHAFLQTGKKLIFSEGQIEAFEAQIYGQFDSLGVPKAVFERSLQYGKAVSDHILAWAEKDNYNQTRTFPKHPVPNDPSKWHPTPPDYMDGIEPHWSKIRPFVLDSATQFVPRGPTPFDMQEGSRFYEETMEVYRALDAEDRAMRIAIAEFWDCNPYVSTHQGHVMFTKKKITPGGHWIGIAALAARKAEADIMQSAEIYALTSLSLADAFISCWDEKYRSNLVRPETVINIFIDKNWRPVLQTPPFPEHTSGHSVISRAAAIALTSLLGDPFPFVDTVEEEYGLPARTFNSFLEASEEAAVSRLYGGIHYRPAIDFGVEQGEKVGKWVVSRVETRIKEAG